MSDSPNFIYGEGVTFSKPITWKRLAGLVGNPFATDGYSIDGATIYPLAGGDAFNEGDE